MKKCPVCNQTYTDESLNFCLSDGATLTKISADPPPTILMNQPRPTNETNWAPPTATTYEPVTGWQNQAPLQNQLSLTPHSTAPLQYQTTNQTPNQTLPTVSLLLGIFSIVLICCYAGIPLGAGALVTGALALKNLNNNPAQYGGRGLAIAGIVTGAIGVSFSVVMIIFIFISNAK